MTKPKALVLGGGMGALTAAFELSRGEWRRHWSEITVYQQGWRLGGKGASGRNTHLHDRIEEHGLHVWFGYYENAFRLVAECHQELDEIALRMRGKGEVWERWSQAMPTPDLGFHRASCVGITDEEPDGWSQWLASFPEDDLLPWDRDLRLDPPDWNGARYIGALADRTAKLLVMAVESTYSDLPRPVIEILDDSRDGSLLHDESALADAAALAAETLRRIDPLVSLAFRSAIEVSRQLQVRAARGLDDEFVALALSQISGVDRVLDYLRSEYDSQIRDNRVLRRAFTLLDLSIGISRGMLYHGIETDEDFDALDAWSWDEWLAVHGVRVETRESALVRGLSYCLPFSYERGNRDAPSFSAGVGLRLLFRTFFTYRGAVMWKMDGGMGDVVFAPLFELLAKRGVTFRFFHQVLDVVPSTEGTTSAIEKIYVKRQLPDFPQSLEPRIGPSVDNDEAELTELLKRYRDLFLVRVPLAGSSDVAPLHYMCWPSKPNVPDTDANVDYEALFGTDRQHNFSIDVAPDDVVIFGLPVATLPFAAPSLLSSPRWNRSLKSMGFVPTQSVQLWLRTSALKGLGWPDDIVASGFGEPFDTFADQPALAALRDPELGARTLIQLCSVMFDSPNRPDGIQKTVEEERQWLADERDRFVRGSLRLFLRDRAGELWPLARDPVSHAFDLGLLVGEQSVTPSAQLYGAEINTALDAVLETHDSAGVYYRANVEPSDLYVQSLPDTVQYRIEPGDSGFINLFPAGDWTKCVLNAGCVEAATISGMLAAEAASGRVLTIIGRLQDSPLEIASAGATSIVWSLE